MLLDAAFQEAFDAVHFDTQCTKYKNTLDCVLLSTDA